MTRKKINSLRVLTPEDKQYLRRVCRYLASLGMEDGSIEQEVEDSYSFDFLDVDWHEHSHFSNNYSVEIPDGLKPIVQKIANFIHEKGLFNPPQEDDLNYERVDFDIDCSKQEISVNHWWSYYSRGDGASVEWEGTEGKKIFEEWEEEGALDDLEVPENGILTLRYNGSGDSGYIESSFEENSDSVPTFIEDWCYRQLENHFGGWEINEGSDGEFQFNFNKMTIHLNHTMNTEESEHDTIYEESFAD